MSAPASTVPAVTDASGLHELELEPEVRDWLNSLSDADYKRVDEVCGMLADKGTSLGGPWVGSPGGTGLGDAAAACPSGGQGNVLVQA